MERVRVLSTKKLQPNQRQYLLNAGFSVLEADFITIRDKPFQLNDIHPNLIFTSRNALEAFLNHPQSSKHAGLPVFCVGAKTAEAAEKAGLKVEASADYAELLADLIVNRHRDRSYTFFSGNLRRDTLPQALEKEGIALNEVQVYETALTPQKLTSPVDAVLFFSPSGVESFLQANDLSGKNCFCIGATTAEALKDKTDKIVIASKPTVENVVVQCINYYKKAPARS